MLLNNNDFKYIIKKVIIFLLIFLFISFFNSCDVHAETYNQISNGVKYYTWDNGEYIYNGQSDEIHYLSNISTYYRFIQTTELKDNSQVLFPGQYLIEFYVYSTYGQMSDFTCYDLKSNFENVNMTTGNWVSNEIKSQCVDLYKTTYNGWNAYRILYKFTYNGANSGADGITELRYSINSSPKDFFFNMSEGSDIGMSSSAIYSYDSSLVSQFNDYKQNQTIISQNGQIISGLDTLNTTQNNNTNSIINNQNSNTQSVIDNQNQNKEDIINNQNSNTDKEIESQQVCENKIIDKNDIFYDNKYLSINGELYTDVVWGVTDYISVTKVVKINTAGSNPSVCFYDINKNLIECRKNPSISIGEITLPTNTYYIRVSINKNENRPQYNIDFCKNGNQAMNDSINDLNDNINNDNVDGANSQVDDLMNNSAFTDNSGIQSIINAPLNFINGLTNSCSPINITIPYLDSDLSIPCIKQELNNHVPTIVPILSTAINGFVIYRILIDIVYLVKSSRNPDDDRIEVLDL